VARLGGAQIDFRMRLVTPAISASANCWKLMPLRAQIDVAAIGRVEIDPNSRVRC
jgi:hypothetical protein